MTRYEQGLPVHVAFDKPPRMVNVAGEYLSNLGLTQFRCAETEKFPHVTFFFNDYREPPFPGESRQMAQSPSVATYDLQPQMSAPQICEIVTSRLAAKDCEDFILVNVLSPETFQQEHIPGSRNIPLQSGQFLQQFREATRGDIHRQLVVYCAGPRCDASAKAAERLREAGYTQVVEFQDGMEQWKREGFPVDSPSESHAESS